MTVEKTTANSAGLEVVEVQSGSPAQQAGIKRGDILISLADQNIDSPEKLKEIVSDHQKSTTESDVRVRLRRDDRARQVTMTLESSKETQQRMREAQSNRQRASANANSNANQNRSTRGSGTQRNRGSAQEHASLGVTLDSTPQRRGQGVRIISVYANSPAQQAGLKTGDRILKVEGRDVSSSHDLQQAIADLDPNDEAEITVLADGEQEELDVVLTSRAETIQRAMVGRQPLSSQRFTQTGQRPMVSGRPQFDSQFNSDQQSLNQTLTQIQ